MIGVLRTLLAVLLWGRGLQRWVMALGLLLIGTGLGTVLPGQHLLAPQPGSFLGLIGAALVAVVAMVTGGMLFRAISAPRTLLLIPRGRLQLLLGMLGTQLLLALLIVLAMLPLMLHAQRPQGGPPPGTAFTFAFGAVTVAFVYFYYAARPAVGMLVPLAFILLLRFLASAFPGLRLVDVLTGPRGVPAVLLATLGAWLVFGITYLRAGRIAAPAAGMGPAAAVTAGMGANSWQLASPLGVLSPGRLLARSYAGQMLRADRRTAIGALLAGPTGLRRLALATALAWSLFYAFMLLASSARDRPARGGDTFAFAFALMVLFSAPVATILTRQLLQRARTLWLAGLDRAELFRTVEHQCWRLLLAVTGTATLLSMAAACTFAAHPEVLWLLALAVVGSALPVYATLLATRSHPVTDAIIWAVVCVQLLALMIAAAAGFRSALPILLALQLLLIPLLRALARYRWYRIDWVLNRPQRLPRWT